MSLNSTLPLPGLDTGSALFERFSHSDAYSISLAAGVLVILVYVGNSVFSRRDSDGFPFLPGLPVVGSWKFFTKRHHFAHEGLSRLGQVFSFNILQVCL